jgi:hypothetical protein
MTPDTEADTTGGDESGEWAPRPGVIERLSIFVVAGLICFGIASIVLSDAISAGIAALVSGVVEMVAENELVARRTARLHRETRSLELTEHAMRTREPPSGLS